MLSFFPSQFCQILGIGINGYHVWHNSVEKCVTFGQIFFCPDSDPKTQQASQHTKWVLQCAAAEYTYAITMVGRGQGQFHFSRSSRIDQDRVKSSGHKNFFASTTDYDVDGCYLWDIHLLSASKISQLPTYIQNFNALLF